MLLIVRLDLAMRIHIFHSLYCVSWYEEFRGNKLYHRKYFNINILYCRYAALRLKELIFSGRNISLSIQSSGYHQRCWIFGCPIQWKRLGCEWTKSNLKSNVRHMPCKSCRWYVYREVLGNKSISSGSFLQNSLETMERYIWSP